MTAVSHVMAFSEVAGQPVFAGAEHHLIELMTAQIAAGFRVRLVMIVVHDGPQLRDKAAELEAAGIDVCTVHHRLSLRARVGPVARLAVLPELVRIFRGRPDDVIHTHLPQASQLGRLAAALAGVRRTVDSVHSDDPAFLRRSWIVRLRVLDRTTGRYIAISESVRRLLVDKVGLPADKVAVVPYGVRPPGPEPSRAEARRELALPQGRFVVGFIGRLTPAKDLPVLLQAVAAMPDVIAVIVGGGEDEQALRATAEAVGADNVVFTGARAGAAGLMRAFDVFCLPSRWEGLGLVLLEAMLREVPIVASRAGAIPEVLDDGACGLLFPCGDSRALVAAIREVEQDPAGARLRAQAALTRVHSEYSVDRMVDGVSDAYARVRHDASR